MGGDRGGWEDWREDQTVLVKYWVCVCVFELGRNCLKCL